MAAPYIVFYMNRRGRGLVQSAAFVHDKDTSALVCSRTCKWSLKSNFLLRSCPRWNNCKQCGSVVVTSPLSLCFLAAECASPLLTLARVQQRQLMSEQRQKQALAMRLRLRGHGWADCADHPVSAPHAVPQAPRLEPQKRPQLLPPTEPLARRSHVERFREGTLWS